MAVAAKPIQARIFLDVVLKPLLCWNARHLVKEHGNQIIELYIVPQNLNDDQNCRLYGHSLIAGQQ